MDPNGIIRKKKVVNRKIGYKRHGHTILKGTAWEDSFESDFDIDSEVHYVIEDIRDLKPFGQNFLEFFTLLKLYASKTLSFESMCNFYCMDEKTHRNLLLLLLSLLIRSPASRSRYENYPKIIGLPPSEEVGKANMVHSYRIAKKLCMTGLISNQYFVFLNSPRKRFIYGDGGLDWLTNSLICNRVSGRALVPLTPNICVYFCSQATTRKNSNCASFLAAPWVVDWVNQITQIYSKDRFFFVGRPPKITDAFQQGQFLEHTEKTDALIDALDEIVRVRKKRDRASWSLGGL